MQSNTFDFDKYKALACGTPAGIKLLLLVEDNWSSWVSEVASAPWLRNWRRAREYGCGGQSPGGAHFSGKHAALALKLFALSSWGFGFEGWLTSKNRGMLPAKRTRLARVAQDLGLKGSACATAVNDPMVSILEAQRVPYPGSARRYFWDEQILKESGLYIPIELGDLDRWLEPLWLIASRPDITFKN